MDNAKVSLHFLTLRNAPGHCVTLKLSEIKKLNYENNNENAKPVQS